MKRKEKAWEWEKTHGKCGTWMGHGVQRERFQYDGAQCMTWWEQSLCMIMGRNVHNFLSLGATMPPMFSAPMAMRCLRLYLLTSILLILYHMSLKCGIQSMCLGFIIDYKFVVSSMQSHILDHRKKCTGQRQQ